MAHRAEPSPAEPNYFGTTGVESSRLTPNKDTWAARDREPVEGAAVPCASIAVERTATAMVTTENRREGKVLDARPEAHGGKRGEMISPRLPQNQFGRRGNGSALTGCLCGHSASLRLCGAVPQSPPAARLSAVLSPA